MAQIQSATLLRTPQGLCREVLWHHSEHRSGCAQPVEETKRLHKRKA